MSTDRTILLGLGIHLTETEPQLGANRTASCKSPSWNDLRPDFLFDGYLTGAGQGVGFRFNTCSFKGGQL